MSRRDMSNEEILLRSEATFNNAYWGYGGDFWEPGEIHISDRSFFFVPKRRDLDIVEYPLSGVLGASRIARSGVIAICDFMLFTMHGDVPQNVPPHDVDRIVSFINSYISKNYGIDDVVRAEHGIYRQNYRMSVLKTLLTAYRMSRLNAEMGPTKATILRRVTDPYRSS